MPAKISELPKGTALHPVLSRNSVVATHDWTHMLSPVHRRNGYKMIAVTDTGDPHKVQNIVLYKKNHEKGYVSIVPFKRHVGLHSFLREEHRGKGLGFRMYEAALAHVYHSMGRKVIANRMAHSPDAHRIHTKLAQKYGLDYWADPNYRPKMGEKEPWYGEYKYTLKSEDE